MTEPVRVLFACSGLEHAQRGFESFAREGFRQLATDPRLDMRLIKASGPHRPGERAVPAITRDGLVARRIGQVWKSSLAVEQAAFALSLQAAIVRYKPQVIYLSEWYTGVALDRLRRLHPRIPYAIVLSNGSMSDRGFEPFDRVHQHTAPALEWVLDRGADPDRQILLPVAFEVDLGRPLPCATDRDALRRRLGLPVERPVLISVAALNSSHKRLDHLIRETARLPRPRPMLLMVGQPEPETEALRGLAASLLEAEDYEFRTVPRIEVDDHLDAADSFVLPSLAEGLPRALVEALAHGLRCIAHDYPVAHYALEQHGRFCDMTEPGALAGLIAQTLVEADEPSAMAARRNSVHRRFSWEVLRPAYVEMLTGAVGRAPFPDARRM